MKRPKGQPTPAFTESQAMDSAAKIPEPICAVLTDIAKIRRTILENAPQCLPLLAPIIVDAENHLHAMRGG